MLYNMSEQNLSVYVDEECLDGRRVFKNIHQKWKYYREEKQDFLTKQYFLIVKHQQNRKDKLTK